MVQQKNDSFDSDRGNFYGDNSIGEDDYDSNKEHNDDNSDSDIDDNEDRFEYTNNGCNIKFSENKNIIEDKDEPNDEDDYIKLANWGVWMGGSILLFYVFRWSKRSKNIG